MLTVDYDRLAVGPGTKFIDVGAGAGRHSFEAYRRGADVIAFDMDAEGLADVDTLLQAMGEAGEAPASAKAQVVVGDALALPYPDGEFDVVVASEILEHVPRRRRRHRRTDPRPQAGRQTRGDRAALAAREDLLDPVRRIPRQRGWPYPDLQGRRTTRQARSRRPHVHSPASRACPALAVLVAQMRCGRGEAESPGGQGLSPAAGVGHDVAPPALTRVAESALNPLVGKSVALYFEKPITNDTLV